jgi:hypothetical protein
VVIQDLLIRVRPIRALLLVIFDSGAWIGSFAFLAWLQVAVHDTASETRIMQAVLVGSACAGAFLLLGSTFRLHQGRSATGSFENAFWLPRSPAWWVANLFAGLVLYVRLGPVLLVAAPLGALMMMIWGRGTYRVLRDRAFGRGVHHGTEPTVVIGAGEGGPSTDPLHVQRRQHQVAPGRARGRRSE